MPNGHLVIRACMHSRQQVQALQRNFRQYNTSQAASVEETVLEHRRLKNEIVSTVLSYDSPYDSP